ncbi:hypothetical protein [Streptomyces seoulensis]|uniref:hypothetical protein n=1 Tax=Streptomyces seoulensis TaxID=73044 RepID=UPI001FCC7245|nr:hypothetical protein [Streptomyces seoulensis]BDH08420.1 hypothetical protein HEK131_56470 [Streptomyces seoulensis]
MSRHPLSPRLKSITTTPTGPRAAEPAAPPAAVGDPEGAARRAPVLLLHHTPRPTGDDPTPDRPGLRIYAPPLYRDHWDGARWSKRGADTPTAAYACHCGQTRTARGAHQVAALVAEYDAHKPNCTGTHAASPERRAAA